MSVLNGAGATEMPSSALNIYTGSSFAAQLFQFFSVRPVALPEVSLML